MKYDIFISYSRKDIEFAKSVCAVLDSYKEYYSFEYFFDQSEVGSANEYLKRISRAIYDSKTVLFLAGQNSYASEFCAKELLFADKRGVHIHQYRIDEAEIPLELDMLLGNHQYREMKSSSIDFFVSEVLADSLGCEILPLEELEEKARLDNLERKERQAAYEQELRDTIKIIEDRRSEIVSEILSHEQAIKVLKQEDIDSKKKIAELYSKLGIKYATNDEVKESDTRQPIGDNESDDIIENLLYKIGQWRGRYVKWVALVVLLVLFGSIAFGAYISWFIGEQPLDEIAVVKTYSEGDYYDDGVKQGVVFEVSEDGKHGKIVSLDETCKMWRTQEQNGKEIFVGASNHSDGQTNTDRVMARTDGANYHAFQWCREKGPWWYLPSIEELMWLYEVKDKVNRTLQKKSMKVLDSWYWSSTEYTSISAWYVNMSNGSTDHRGKTYGVINVRAVATF